MEKDTKYRKYLEGLKKATKKESFLERRMKLGGKDALSYAAKAAKASKYGKIAGAVAAAGIAGSAFLRSKMKDIKEKQQAEGKMGGGMMYKYKSGGLSPKQKKIARMAPPPDKITGDDFKAMKTMKAKSGAMVYVKTKIGKNKPTKIC